MKFKSKVNTDLNTDISEAIERDLTRLEGRMAFLSERVASLSAGVSRLERDYDSLKREQSVQRDNKMQVINTMVLLENEKYTLRVTTAEDHNHNPIKDQLKLKISWTQTSMRGNYSPSWVEFSLEEAEQVARRLNDFVKNQADSI